jgi:hypothetical protein
MLLSWSVPSLQALEQQGLHSSVGLVEQVRQGEIMQQLDSLVEKYAATWFSQHSLHSGGKLAKHCYALFHQQGSLNLPNQVTFAANVVWLALNLNLFTLLTAPKLRTVLAPGVSSAWASLPGAGTAALRGALGVLPANQAWCLRPVAAALLAHLRELAAVHLPRVSHPAGHLPFIYGSILSGSRPCSHKRYGVKPCD